MFDGDHDGNDAGQVDRCKGPWGQRESTLQSRQPRVCKASVLCISLWMVSTNRLTTCCTAVDERGCGKVDNSQGTSLAQVGNFHRPNWREGFATEDDAKAARDDARVKARHGEYIDRNRITVTAYLGEWIDAHAMEIKPPRRQEDHHHRLYGCDRRQACQWHDQERPDARRLY
jgi:hypothetical protein